MSADDCIYQARALLIFFQAIFVGRHPLKTQSVDGPQVGIHLHETVRIEQIVDPVLGGLREMIIAVRTDALVLGELDFVNDFAASCALLKEPMWNITLFRTLCFYCRFFENGHGN